MPTARLSEKRSAERRVAQLPVAVVGGDDRAGAQAALQLLARLARDDLGGLGQRDLDLGDRGDRDLGRQHVVEDVIVAQIGVGEDIVADPLARAQAAAMADHQPRLGPQHREVVADRLGVRRADADVDQRDAGAVRRPSGDRRASGAAATRCREIDLRRRRRRAWITTPPAPDSAGEAADPSPSCDAAPADELVDVAVVVGEQHVALHMLGRRAGVVAQPREAEVGAQRRRTARAGGCRRARSTGRRRSRRRCARARSRGR